MYQSHSETSKAAYDTVDEPGQLEDTLTAFFRFQSDGATCEQVFFHMREQEKYRNLSVGTIAARMTTLKRDGKIFYKNMTRKTTSGKEAEVWVHDEWATDGEKLLTAQKPTTKRQQCLELIESTEKFLNALQTGKIVSGVWLNGLNHNIANLKKAADLLK